MSFRNQIRTFISKLNLGKLMMLILFSSFFGNKVDAQYLETFDADNKGYLLNQGSDFTGVDWSLSSWTVIGRDNNDYACTGPIASGGTLYEACPNNVFGIVDADEEVTWMTPQLVAQTTGSINLSVDLAWSLFDGEPATDYANVEYQINNGSWIRHPNILGSSGYSAYTVKYSTTSTNNSGSGTSSVMSVPVTVGDVVRLRIVVFQNGNSELFTFDNVSISNVQLPVLSVELLSFKGFPQYDGNLLTWTTVSETNNKGFDIERSRDGETFQAIGTVKAIGKAGNYNFTDAEPVNGTNYYRLRQIDNDGTETYSKVVSVANKGGKALKVYPTLVSNGFLTVDSEGSDYAIYNIVGQQVQSGKTAQRLDVSVLAKGTYILKVGTEQAKFVKQ